jgi:hypothetical protein
MMARGFMLTFIAKKAITVTQRTGIPEPGNLCVDFHWMRSGISWCIHFLKQIEEHVAPQSF